MGIEQQALAWVSGQADSDYRLRETRFTAGGGAQVTMEVGRVFVGMHLGGQGGQRIAVEEARICRKERGRRLDICSSRGQEQVVKMQDRL